MAERLGEAKALQERFSVQRRDVTHLQGRAPGPLETGAAGSTSASLAWGGMGASAALG